ncbi:DUF1932 domain-containing protein [Streptomyces sp. NPDC006733]|uniref:DUF1932 domain-containing protein n=1 Tax=Streptomyces sp. NPDC006733 TaxID=3155460 RepID=UPI00340B385A
MTGPIVGILHPGSMGAAVAAQAATHAATVLWCPAGRSERTVARATRFGLEPVATSADLLDRADIVISLCPPAAAEDVAREVGAHGFEGLYLEANAISPQRVGRIVDLLPEALVLDGAVTGTPPAGGEAPTLFLAGLAPAAAVVEKLFAGTDVTTKVLGDTVGQASALKLAYAGLRKTSEVMAAVSLAMAQEHGVGPELLALTSRLASPLAAPDRVAGTAARAWRWGPELDEAADLAAAAGLPEDLLRAAARTLARWSDSKDDDALSADEALRRLRRA